MTTRLCFTVDLDRDVNICLPERPGEAGSIDRGNGTEPRFESTLKGLAHLTDLLNEMGVPCTFFCEGRTIEVIRDYAGLLDGFELGVHGYNHESLIDLERSEAVSAVHHAVDVIKDVTGRSPLSFRAPYMNVPDASYLLKGTGIRVDSSTYAQAGDCVPYDLPGGITEIPVAEDVDANGRKISAYLWPMHEGKRDPLDYAGIVPHVPENGVFVLADHTWHLVESRKNGVMNADEVASNVERTREALQAVLDTGCEAVTVSQAARSVR